jgi:hypothetical protein
VNGIACSGIGGSRRGRPPRRRRGRWRRVDGRAHVRRGTPHRERGDRRRHRTATRRRGPAGRGPLGPTGRCRVGADRRRPVARAGPADHRAADPADRDAAGHGLGKGRGPQPRADDAVRDQHLPGHVRHRCQAHVRHVRPDRQDRREPRGRWRGLHPGGAGRRDRRTPRGGRRPRPRCSDCSPGSCRRCGVGGAGQRRSWRLDGSPGSSTTGTAPGATNWSRGPTACSTSTSARWTTRPLSDTSRSVGSTSNGAGRSTWSSSCRTPSRCTNSSSSVGNGSAGTKPGRSPCSPATHGRVRRGVTTSLKSPAALEGRGDVAAALREGADDPVGALRACGAGGRGPARRVVPHPRVADRQLRPGLARPCGTPGPGDGPVARRRDGSRRRVTDQGTRPSRSRVRHSGRTTCPSSIVCSRRRGGPTPTARRTSSTATTFPCGLLRRWLVEVSRRLVARGLLGRVDDGPWLLADELVAGLRGAT